MCRSTNYYRHSRFLRLKSISLRLSLSSTALSLLPESLTLVFLPRINGGLLEVNGSKFLPDSPAFVSLHRAMDSKFEFSSKDRVRTCYGIVFEIHIGEKRFIRGVLRQCEDNGLRMECKCVLEREFGVREAEVVVAIENGMVLKERVVAKRRRRRNCQKFELALEDIPEERESDVYDEEEEGLDVACCCCDEGEDEEGLDGGDVVDSDRKMEKEMEGVRWAVDVGVWAVCLGVGLFVSRASARRLRRTKFLC